MSKITVCLENGSHDNLNNSFINATTDTKMAIRNVAVFWNFFNVLTDVNDTVIIISKTGVHTKVTLDEGYYTFDMIRDKLSEHNLVLERNSHNNTCKIHMIVSSDIDSVKLGKFGKLLGFPDSLDLTVGQGPQISPNTVDINQGLKFVTIGCSVINRDKNFDTYGNRSDVVVTLPVTSEQPLNSTVTHFNDVNSKVPVINGFHNRVRFNIGTNIGNVGLKVLFDCYIK